MIVSTKSGWCQPDLLIKGAIIAGLDDIRKNPWLLDYCFAWVVNDDLTNKEYGAKELDRIKKYLLSHEIFVTMNFRADDITFPLVSIGLVNSTEDVATLGDIDSEPTEEVEVSEVTNTPNILVGPFTPASYDSTTGIITLPDNLSTELIFADTTLILDTKNNVGYPITDVINESSFTIAEDVNANFTNATIAPIADYFITSFESCLFKQTFSIKCFTQGDPLYTLYLHTLIEFILMRYKQAYLEGRGFDRSVISSGPLYQFQEMGVEMTFARDITLSGYVRQYWPKTVAAPLVGIKLYGIEVIGSSSPISELPNVKVQGWGEEGDYLNIDSLGI